MDFHELLHPVPRYAVFKMEQYMVWCGSMVAGPDGLFYLFFSRWPEELGHFAWWEYRNNQRVGVAVADHPAGPWTRFNKPLIDVTRHSFDHLATSNPTVCVGPEGNFCRYLFLQWLRLDCSML